jgi:hypothetical protein
MKYLKLYESFKMNESFVDAKGNPMDQKEIVKQTHDALIYSKGDFNKFKELMSSEKQIQGQGLDPWKVHYEKSPITDEKTLKTLFDTYRPVAGLNENAFIWLINKFYGLANEKFGNGNYADFVTSVKNSHHANLSLRSSDNVSAGALNVGQTRFILNGPFSYRYQKGYYYQTEDSAKTTDISIVIYPNLWTIEPKTSKGTEIMKTVLNDRKAFDTYSGWYTGEIFNFILYKYKAPKTEIKPVQAKEGEKQPKEPGAKPEEVKKEVQPVQQ